MDGQFIAVEGPKAAGKTTLVAALASRLDRDRCRHVVVTKEPTPRFDSNSEERLRGVELAAAIASDRARHVAEVVGPALAAGLTVVCDRYILSSYVFHALDGVSPTIVAGLNRDFPRPTLNLVLRVGPEELRRRRGGRGAATRLQAADVESEVAAYLRFATHMHTDGVPNRVVDNATMTDHQQLLSLLASLCLGVGDD